jgi:hypothetical protein
MTGGGRRMMGGGGGRCIGGNRIGVMGVLGIRPPGFTIGVGVC